MKEQAGQYLSSDVHQTMVIANQRDESGKVVLQATVPTEVQAILRLVKGAGLRVYVAFEEGPQFVVPRSWPSCALRFASGRSGTSGR